MTSTTALAPPPRDERGRVLPGHSLNPGGRPRLPPEFTAKGPTRLTAMAKIADDEEHEHHFDALRWCLEKQYGKPAILDEEGEEQATSTLMKLVALASPKPQIIDAEFTEPKEPP